MLKKSMDILDVYSWVKRHSQDLVGCYIDNVYRSEYYWLIKLRCRASSPTLKVEPGVRLHLSHSEPGSKDIDSFSRYLRAHVRDSRIAMIDQPWWERIIQVETEGKGGVYRHYIELLPRGLWVITDRESRILYSSRFQEFKDRVVKVGAGYKPPPMKGLSPWNTSELIDALKRGKDLVRGIVYEWGLPGYIAEEVIYRSGLINQKNRNPSDLPSQDQSRLVEEYLNLVKEAEIGSGYLVIGEKRVELYTVYNPVLFREHYVKEVTATSSIDEAIDKYFTELEGFLEEEKRRKQLEEEYENWRRRIDEQLKIIAEYEATLNAIQRKLTLIYANYETLDRLLECARGVVKSTGWETIEACGVRQYDKNRGVVMVEINGEIIEVSIREPLYNQVVSLEIERGEVKKKIEKAKSILKELEEGLHRVRSELSIRVYAKPSPVFWFEKYRWSITRNGFLVIAGRDASQNEAIVRRYLGEDDIFLHADIHGAPATILIVGNRAPSEEDIHDASVIAGCYSRAWKEGFSYIDVFWVRGRQVSKTPPPGMYIAKGSFMIYGERNYIKTRLLLGLGLRMFCDDVYGEYVKIFTGPPDIVKETSISYVILAPGDLKRDEAIREIKNTLLENARLKTGVMYRIIDDSIQSALPGDVRIIERGVGRGLDKCIE